MSDNFFIDMLSYRKGDDSPYRPVINEICMLSPPNFDDENGYVYFEVEILWKDDIFVVYRKEGHWPVVTKWEHIRSKPVGSNNG